MGNFNNLTKDVQEDLATWCNRSFLTKEDKEMLFNLFDSGDFKVWDCPVCGERCFFAPIKYQEWFQGSRGCDYVTYPGNNGVFTFSFIRSMCDSCRSHKDCSFVPADCWIEE